MRLNQVKTEIEKGKLQMEIDIEDYQSTYRVVL